MKKGAESWLNIMLDDGAKMPTRAYKDDAGLDFYANEDCYLFAGQAHDFESGVHVQIPKGYEGKMESKSGLMSKRVITLGGVIDSGYTGSIRITLFNFGNEAVMIHKGDKITQMVIHSIITPKPRLVTEFEETERGNNGFGSTGKR